MDDRYISFWTILCWIPAGLMFLLAGLCFAPFMQDRSMSQDDPRKAVVPAIVFGLVLTVVGLGVRGSRSSDALDEARSNYYKAAAALEALPLVGTEGLLRSCMDASIVGKDRFGRDLVSCKQVNGKTIRFVMNDP